MKIILFFVLLCSILAIPLDRRDVLSTIVKPVEQGLQSITKPASTILHQLVQHITPPISISTTMHFISEEGQKIRISVTPKFLERHVSFNGERPPSFGRYPAKNTVIDKKAIVWEEPTLIVNHDGTSSGRLEFLSKNPEKVDQYLHIGDGVYKKSETTVKRLVAHGSLQGGKHVIDHFHGTVNEKLHSKL